MFSIFTILISFCQNLWFLVAFYYFLSLISETQTKDMYTGVRNPPKLLLTKQTVDVFTLISVKWNLSSHILYFIYMQRLAIQFVEMHCMRTHISFFYILISIRVTIAFYLQTDTCLQLKKITTVFLFLLLQFDYEVWEIIIYFRTCFSFWSLFYTDFLQRI